MAGIMTDAELRQYPQLFGNAVRPVEEVVVYGRVIQKSDPMWRDEGNRAILKRVRVDDLPRTVIRWIALGRKISEIHPYFPGC